MDESARLIIQADTDQLVRAGEQVEKLNRELQSVVGTASRGAGGWEAQSRAVDELTAKLRVAEREYKQLRSTMSLGSGTTGVGMGGGLVSPAGVGSGVPFGNMGGGGRDASGRMDAGRTSMLGMSVANTLQDAYYSPAFAVNNLMFMAQMSGGVKQLTKDLAQLGTTAVVSIGRFPAMLGTAAMAFPGATVAVAGLGVAAYGLHTSLKEAGLSWNDLGEVLSNLAPLQAAGDSLKKTAEDVEKSVSGEFFKGFLEGVGGIVAAPVLGTMEVAKYALGWDEATEAVRQHNEELAKATLLAQEVASARKSLAGVQSEAQKATEAEGKELVQKLAELGGAGGLTATIGKIANSGVDGLKGQRAIDRTTVMMDRAQGGDADAIRQVAEWAKKAGLDPASVVTKAGREKAEAEAKKSSAGMTKIIGGDLDRVADVISDKWTTVPEKFDALNGAIERINRQVEAGTLTDEDYARVLERTTDLKKKAADAEMALAVAHDAAATKALEEEAAKNEALYDRRVDKRADLYGQAYGGGLARAQYDAASRGEDQETTDARLKQQLMARMRNIAPGMREGVADEVLKRSRGMAEDYAIQRGFQRDMVGAQLGAQAVGGDQRTLIGQMNRQQALAMGKAQGIDVNAYGKAMEAAAPSEKQLEAATTMKDAVKEFREVIRNVEVRL